MAVRDQLPVTVTRSSKILDPITARDCGNLESWWPRRALSVSHVQDFEEAFTSFPGRATLRIKSMR